MATLTRDGLDLHYEVTGSGPALLLPKFNYFRWDDYLDVGLLAGRFTVVIASPRGFAASSRLAADGDYRVADLASDLVTAFVRRDSCLTQSGLTSCSVRHADLGSSNGL